MTPDAERSVVLNAALATALYDRNDVVGLPPAHLARDVPALGLHGGAALLDGALYARAVPSEVSTVAFHQVSRHRDAPAVASVPAMNKIVVFPGPVPYARHLASGLGSFRVHTALSAHTTVALVQLAPDVLAGVGDHPAIDALIRVPGAPALAGWASASARAHDLALWVEQSPG